MLVYIFTLLVLIYPYALGPCCCYPIGYTGNAYIKNEAKRDLDDMRIDSGAQRKMAIGHEKLIVRKKGIDRKNRQEDIVQIPDDMVITNRDCGTTKEKCDSSDPLSTIKAQSKKKYDPRFEASRNRPPRDINPQQYAPDPTEADFRRQVATIMLERLRQDGSRIEIPSINNQENSSITSRQKVAVNQAHSYGCGCQCGCQSVCPCQNTT